MKVLLANSPFLGGGITTYATQLIQCLSGDTDLTVVLGDDKAAPIKDPRVKVLYHNTKLLSISNALFFIHLINDDIKPDVIIASAATIIPVIAPFLDDGIRVFTVSHSGKFFMSDYSAINHKYLDGIIAASSDYNKQYLERKFHIENKNKIKVIYNFMDGDDDIEALRFEKSTQNPISIVYAGATSVHKSPELVAKIVNRLLSTDLKFKFFWTGNNPMPLSKTIFKYSKLKSVEQLMTKDERLVFTGRIPSKQEYDKLLGSANIMLAPSKNEGCSMAVLEGHRAGCIFVVADFKNSNSEIVRKGNSGFIVDHRDVDKFVDIISDIIKNPQAYTEFYKRSHNTFTSLLTYPIWRTKIFEVINGEYNHKKRKSAVSKTSILYGIMRMKLLQKESLYNVFFLLTLPSSLSLYWQYRTNKRNQKTLE